MSLVSMRVEGYERLVKKLDRAGRGDLRRVAKKLTGQAMGPVLVAARENAPVNSGRLRASIGKLSTQNRRGTSFGTRVGTRRDFVYKTTEGERVVSGRGKIRDRAVKKGIRQDKKTAQQYARGIEFGVTKSGKTARAAGGAFFLERAIQSHRRAAISTLSAGLRAHLNSLKD